MALTFAFDTSKGETPESVRRKRDMVRALMGAQRAPQNVGEGLNALGDGIVAAILDSRADRAESAGRASAADTFNAAVGGGYYPPAPGAAPVASGPNPNSVQSGIDHAQRGEGNSVRDAFMGEVGKTVTNPYALAAIAATGEHESGFDRDNSTRTWSDPSQSGQPGTAGGIMSWRGDRLARLQAFGGGDLSPAKQAAFFLQEDPALISALGNAKSVEEAQSLMNNAWRFAGYDQPGGEAGARLASAAAYLPQYQKGGAALEQMAGADPSGEWLRYANQGATRSLPLNQKLTSALSFLPEMGVQMEVFSGGQPGKGEGGARVGSTRHDHGGAADAFFYKNGRKLDWANPDDLPIFEEIVRRGKAAGLTGFGAGEGYMQPGSMHLGFGTPMTWGAGGSSENAPAWLRKAYETQVASLGDPSQFLDQGGRSMSPDAAASVAAASAPAPYRATGVDPAGMVQPTGSTRIAQALTGTDTPEMAGRGQGRSIPQLLGALNNEWLSDGQRKILGAMIEQEMQREDPAYQLGLEKTRTELDLLKNPRLSPYEEAQIGFKRTEQEAAAAKAAQEQANADRSFGLDERKFTSESEDRTADNARADQELNIKQLEYLLKTQPDFYAKYVQQEEAAGRTPLGVLDYATQLKKAGANNTTVSVGGEPGDGELRKALDKGEGELWTQYKQQGATSGAMGQDFEILDELIKVAPQGLLSGRLAEMFPGVSSAGDAFQSIVKRIAPTLRAPGSGATSDIEYDGMLKSLPALRNQPEANAMIASIMKAKAMINMRRADIITKYQTGDFSAAEARRQIGEIDKQSIMTPEMRRALVGVGGAAEEEAGGAPKAGDVLDGYRFKGGDPGDQANWEPVQ